jgi:hypothetical protein
MSEFVAAMLALRGHSCGTLPILMSEFQLEHPDEKGIASEETQNCRSEGIDRL